MTTQASQHASYRAVKMEPSNGLTSERPGAVGSLVHCWSAAADHPSMAEWFASFLSYISPAERLLESGDPSSVWVAQNDAVNGTGLLCKLLQNLLSSHLPCGSTIIRQPLPALASLLPFSPYPRQPDRCDCMRDVSVSVSVTRATMSEETVLHPAVPSNRAEQHPLQWRAAISVCSSGLRCCCTSIRPANDHRARCF